LALSFGKPKEEDVLALIAARKYGRAIEILRTQLRKRGPNQTVRKQLADVLVMAGKTSEAVALLLPLADEFANDGFAAKAVAILKKIQKLDPGRRDIEPRLARLIEERQREAVVLPYARGGSAIGIEETADGPAEGGIADTGPVLEIGFALAPMSAPVAPPTPLAPTSPPASPPEPSRREPAVEQAAAASSPSAGDADAPALDEEIEDYDLLYAVEDEEETAEDVDALIPLPAAAETMSDGQFADELMSLVDSVFQEFPGGGADEAARSLPPGSPRTGSQIVVSPLFRDFSVDEMVAVIHGLKLLTVERGTAIIREGQAGGSLYMLTSGRVRAFKKDPYTGKQSQLADLKEGAFFGEMSILSGEPRMASVVALTRCELLELDRPTLDQITKTHPHVWDVLREFAEKRAAAARR